MARINIEDDLYTQRGWFDLLIALKSPDTAIGALVRAWTFAQKYYFPNREPIPKDVWKNERLSDELINAGFAIETEEGVMMTGNETRFQWLFSASEKGKKGGEKSSAAKKSPEPQPSTGQAQPSTGQPELEKSGENSTSAKPLSLSPSLPLSHSLDLNQSQTTRGEILDFKNAQQKSIAEIQQNLKEKNITITPDQVIDLFNKTLAGTGKLNFCRGLGSPSLLNMLDTFDKFPTIDDWFHLFNQVKKSKSITGEEPGVFLATLDWLAVKENALKADAGKYNVLKSAASPSGNYDLTDDEINQLREAGEL